MRFVKGLLIFIILVAFTFFGVLVAGKNGFIDVSFVKETPLEGLLNSGLVPVFTELPKEKNNKDIPEKDKLKDEKQVDESDVPKSDQKDVEKNNTQEKEKIEKPIEDKKNVQAKKDINEDIDPVRGAKKLAKIWNEIPPKDLNEIIQKWDDGRLAFVLFYMDSGVTAELLKIMEAERSARISRLIQSVGSGALKFE